MPELISKLWKGIETVPFDADKLAMISSTPPCFEVAEYLKLLPVVDVITNGVRFMSPSSVLIENSDFIPGCYISPFGFLVFAALASGTVFAVELSTGISYLIPTELYESPAWISSGWNEDHTAFLPDIPISADNIKASSPVSFNSISLFLKQSLEDLRE